MSIPIRQQPQSITFNQNRSYIQPPHINQQVRQVTNQPFTHQSVPQLIQTPLIYIQPIVVYCAPVVQANLNPVVRSTTMTRSASLNQRPLLGQSPSLNQQVIQNQRTVQNQPPLLNERQQQLPQSRQPPQQYQSPQLREPRQINQTHLLNQTTQFQQSKSQNDFLNQSYQDYIREYETTNDFLEREIEILKYIQRDAQHITIVSPNLHQDIEHDQTQEYRRTYENPMNVNSISFGDRSWNKYKTPQRDYDYTPIKSRIQVLRTPLKDEHMKTPIKRQPMSEGRPRQRLSRDHPDQEKMRVMDLN